MMGSDTPSADTSRESARKSQLPQQPGTTPNCLQALLAKKNADRARISPHPTTPALPPLRPYCPAKDRLLKWQPLLISTVPPLREDLEDRYQLTALAWEPSTLTSYASGLLVFHTWGDSKNLPEAERAPVPQDILAAFITDLAGAYTYRV
jgi:hypothetical protein